MFGIVLRFHTYRLFDHTGATAAAGMREGNFALFGFCDLA
jgi:hypothetical protein